MRHGSQIDPPNRFEKMQRELDLEHLEWDQEYLDGLQKRPIEYLPDSSQSIVSENDSPDVPFRYSVNPYRGCVHGCAYCYARNSHEYLGLSAGLDFETKIFVKERAPQLFREFLARPNWTPELVAFSGVTDCYQPAERTYRLTRQCLEVALECRLPVGIVTKNALVVRDLDLLTEMSAQRLIHVHLSINSLDVELTRVMEPRASTTAARLRAVRMLAEAGVPVSVIVAPIIPGLNDSEMPEVLQAAREAGAMCASYVLLRLPLTVEPVFRDWLERTQPTKAPRVEQRIQATRAGKSNSAKFGERMRGTGPIAEQVGQMFQLFSRKLGFQKKSPPRDFSQFKPPALPGSQRRLF